VINESNSLDINNSKRIIATFNK